MGLMFSFTPIYISEIQFNLTNSGSKPITITECGDCPFDEHFPTKLEPGKTDNAHVSRRLVA